MTHFGETLAQFRKVKYRQTQKEVAEGAALHDSYISLLERGMRESPSRGTVLNIAKALDMTPEDRNSLLLAAGFAPDTVNALLFEPRLADLDDVMANLPDSETRDIIRSEIDRLITLGRQEIGP